MDSCNASSALGVLGESAWKPNSKEDRKQKKLILAKNPNSMIIFRNRTTTKITTMTMENDVIDVIDNYDNSDTDDDDSDHNGNNDDDHNDQNYKEKRQR